MRFNTRMMLAIGCVSLLTLSIPAFSFPSPQANAHKQRALQKKNVAQQGTKVHLNPRAARENNAARLVSMPIGETPKRPMFGWPALVSEARKYMGTNPTARSRLWCATFMNMVLAKVGYAGTNSDAAKSFSQYGHRISEPKIGAIAVLTRGKRGGHVGVVSGIDKNGNPIIISGNHGHRVGEASYPRSRVIAYVMPSDRGPGNTQGSTQVAERSQPNRPTPEHGIESPIAELLAAIEAEQSRLERPNQPQRASQPPRPGQPVPQAQPVQPRRVVQQASPQPVEAHRTVQQMPEQPRPTQRTGILPLNPALAQLLGLKDRAQAAPPPPQQQQQRQRQAEQSRPGRVARTDTGLAGAFSFR
jgi:uncharacterized protein (TIGR02594 family)